MNYLVMECHPAYVIVLDEMGCVQKAANLGYCQGQTVSDVIAFQPMDWIEPKHTLHWKKLTSIAACLCLVMFMGWSLTFTAYGTVRIQINPDVELTVNRFYDVIHCRGLNRDGGRLLDGQRQMLRNVDEISADLINKAEKMGYLDRNHTIYITIQSDHHEWSEQLERRLTVTAEENAPSTVGVVVEADSDGRGAALKEEQWDDLQTSEDPGELNANAGGETSDLQPEQKEESPVPSERNTGKTAEEDHDSDWDEENAAPDEGPEDDSADEDETDDEDDDDPLDEDETDDEGEDDLSDECEADEDDEDDGDDDESDADEDECEDDGVDPGCISDESQNEEMTD